jgi:hypothetical protein
MEKKYYKIFYLLKRRPGMSVEAFREYYETSHAKLGAKYSQGVSRYFRRFLDPMPNPETGESGELAYDVITELWMEDERTFLAMKEYISNNLMPPDIIEDEKNLFDRPKIRTASVVEFETDPATLGQP